MNWLLIAGGILFTPTPSTPNAPEVEMINHTLAGDPVPAKDVTTRSRWGTPMMPNGTGGYSLIQSIVPMWVAQSLVQPPKTGGEVFRPEGK